MTDKNLKSRDTITWSHDLYYVINAVIINLRIFSHFGIKCRSYIKLQRRERERERERD